MVTNAVSPATREPVDLIIWSVGMIPGVALRFWVPEGSLRFVGYVDASAGGALAHCGEKMLKCEADWKAGSACVLVHQRFELHPCVHSGPVQVEEPRDHLLGLFLRRVPLYDRTTLHTFLLLSQCCGDPSAEVSLPRRTPPPVGM